MMSHTTRAKFLLFVILFLGTAAEIFAADGDLDTSFDGDGIVITDNNSNTESIADLAVQPDGKIIAVGTSYPSATLQAVVVRYNPDGSLDSTFGTGGKAFIPTISPSSVALQPDGKIVVGGSYFVGLLGGEFPIYDFFVGRLNSNGSLDTTFNGTGKLVLDLSGGSDVANSVKIQPDGKILLAGSSNQTTIGANDYAIVRFNPDGSFDTTFDGDGRVFTTITPQGTSVFLNEIAIKADGKIVATGSAYLFPQQGEGVDDAIATVSYNPDGSLDTSFGGDGRVFTQEPSERSFGNSVIVQPGGKILVVGRSRSFNGQDRTYLVRYNADGSFDSSFGAGGKSLPSGGSANDVEVQSDNKILIALTFGLSQGSLGFVGRLRADGSPDPTFSGDGFNGFPLPASHSANSVALQPNGKVLIGGSVGTSGSQDFILARFENSVCTVNCPAPSREKIADFDGDGKTDLSVFRNGTWFINPSSANNPNSFYGVQFGLATDKLTPADFDGDGKTDIAVWRENVNGTFGYFYILQSLTNTFRAAQFGQTGDDPRVVGDWDGDGLADPAFYRNGASPGAPSAFFYRPSTQPSVDFVKVNWGTAGDQAVHGDFDGDRRMDAAVFRPSDGFWHVLNSSNNQLRSARWGFASDQRVTGDFDGDGRDDFAFYRDGLWAIIESSNNQPRYVNWGLSSDRVVAGDYDGDGKTDIAVYRDGIWYLLRSQQGFAAEHFGLANDRPIPAAFVP